MPINKKQLFRLIKLVAELKENRYPNCQSFADKLLKLDLYQNENVACTAKTIQRDIKTLKDYGAHIEFDYENNGFCLTNRGWNFICPSLQDEEMMASVFGAKVAEDIFPEPVKSRIRKAVDTQLAGNTSDFLDNAFIEALVVASGVKVEIDPKVFKTVFDAWQTRHALDIKYRAPDGTMSERCIDPHVLTYYKESWYIKGFCLNSNAVKLFAVHRIKTAKITDKTFTPDKKIINSVINGDVYEYDKIKDVEVWLSPESANYAREQKRKKGEMLTFNKDGSAVLYMPEAVPGEIVKWVMWECGRAKILKPASLIKEIASICKEIAGQHKS